MYELVMSGKNRNAPRLVSAAPLSEPDFFDVAERLQVQPMAAHKVALIAARLSGKQQRIETLWDGKETQNLAGPDDWIVTSLTADKAILCDKDGNTNTYVIRSERFPEIYHRQPGHNDFGDFYRSISKVEAIFLAGGFEIMTPWQEVQSAASGYLLLNDAMRSTATTPIPSMLLIPSAA